ncbi:MAG: hypothetical protein KJ749_12755 [Planctomycetes bacterium]|nr:hypothetical protein [Planctomycetota bacterium]
MTMVAVILQVGYYLIMGYGVYVCCQALRAGKRKAWLLIAAFCFSSFLLLGMRQMPKLMHRGQERYTEQHQRTEADGEGNRANVIGWNLPVFPFLLVLGLSLLAEDEIKRNRSTTSTMQPTS